MNPQAPVTRLRGINHAPSTNRRSPEKLLSVRCVEHQIHVPVLRAAAGFAREYTKALIFGTDLSKGAVDVGIGVNPSTDPAQTKKGARISFRWRR
jgi:hypothetical protein